MSTQESKESIRSVVEEIAELFSVILSVPMESRVRKNKAIISPKQPVKSYMINIHSITEQIPGDVLFMRLENPEPLRQKRITLKTYFDGDFIEIRIKLQYAEGRTAIIPKLGREYAVTRKSSLIAFSDEKECGVRTSIGGTFDLILARAILNGLDPKEPWVIPFLEEMEDLIKS